MAAAAARRLGKRDFGRNAYVGLRRAPVGAVLRRRRARAMSGPPTTPLVSIYDGRECVGFVISRGKLGYEAIDRVERSLGVYQTQGEAAQRVMETAP
jgi:hypothetical protein